MEFDTVKNRRYYIEMLIENMRGETNIHVRIEDNDGHRVEFTACCDGLMHEEALPSTSLTHMSRSLFVE